MMICRICGNVSQKVFHKKVLGKYLTNYYHCDRCEFLQTDPPNWLNEAYASALSHRDTGLVRRPLNLRTPICRLIQKHFNPDGKFLDYGAGAGLFVRMMRDLGYDFYASDKYAQNIFAQGFNETDLPDTKKRFELITAFEVMEHLPEPLATFEHLLKMTDSILFSSELQPSEAAKDLENWNYLGEEHGQHISFYTEKTLQIIAQKFGIKYHRCGKYLHLFSRKELSIWLDPSSLREKLLIRKIRGVYQHLFRTESYWLTRRPPLD